MLPKPTPVYVWNPIFKVDQRRGLVYPVAGGVGRVVDPHEDDSVAVAVVVNCLQRGQEALVLGIGLVV